MDVKGQRVLVAENGWRCRVEDTTAMAQGLRELIFV
jgi:hypothetical protein